MGNKLFFPLKIKDVTFRNRIAISPMCQYSATDGFATDWHLVHLGSRAVGGAGLVIQEATAVSPEGRISPGDLGLYLDAHVEKLRNIAAFIRQQGAVPGVQLAHAGRKASCAVPWQSGKQLPSEAGGWQTVAPSAIPFSPADFAPVSLEKHDILRIVSSFRMAAARAFEAGYQVVEIHAAHGYLLHEFLSPLINYRRDEFGGSFENRIRLLLEVVREVKTVWPSNLPLFVRLSVTDWADGGWNLEESVELSKVLRDLGVDLIDCSSGGMVPHAKIPVVPGYQVGFAETIRRECGIATGAVGLITDARQAEEILKNEQADLVLFAREALRDPYLALHAAKTLGEDIDWPLQYVRAKS